MNILFAVGNIETSKTDLSKMRVEFSAYQAKNVYLSSVVAF